MNKNLREQVRAKYGGLCAYSGKPLDDKWQVDHITPKWHYIWQQPSTTKKVNDLENLLPTLRILNHYKREKDLEQWRTYLKYLHIRLRRLPKHPKVERSIRRKQYILEVAEAFGITHSQPFSGVFYFETLKPQ